MDYHEVIRKIDSFARPETLKSMERFGINAQNARGVSLYDLRKIARETGKDHELALKLWDSGIHEARMLATMIGKSELVTDELIESWVRDFASWDICDQCCSNLFDRTRFAYGKAFSWSGAEEEFIKRAGFVLMACLAVHDKNAPDEKLLDFMPVIVRESTDNRNFVKKAVNWALRQIGKRNLHLNRVAIEAAREIQKIDTKSARWIASDALRELTGEKVQKRLSGLK